MNDLQTFYGPNAGYALELYERYQRDPSSVDPATRAIFDTWSPGPLTPKQVTTSEEATFQVSHIMAASALAHAIRERGHLGAHLDPLGSAPLGDPALLKETHGISDEDLVQLPPGVIGGHAAEGVNNALEAITALRAMYSGTISYEFDQVKSPVERRWLRDAVGLNLYRVTPSPTVSRKLLQRLTQVEAFERYLHQTYPGQKRFSLEGTDVLVPMLDEIISGAVESDTEKVIIGMAHRGRLNVLAHVLEKPYQAILTEFGHPKREEGVPLTDSFGFGWTGDVKYHLGAEHILGEGHSVELKIILSPNPSHLEFVNPIVEGMTRALQETRNEPGDPEQDVDRALPILIHGDAAFPGEGIVAETLNLWHLQGYYVGGTMHIVVDNQLGFTTEPRDSRSTHFASDLAQAYRDQFHKDILIDLVGYRRWGHNEGDEPAFTQPQMYETIFSHPTVRELYARYLESRGIVSREEADAMVKEAFAVLEQAKREADEALQHVEQEEPDGLNGRYEELEKPPSVAEQQLMAFNQELLIWPQGFTPNRKLTRLLQRRATTLGPEGGIDWGQAEALAFASILADGTPIRLTGQDTERGTFSHRHAVLHDQLTGEHYIPLQHLSRAKTSFSIFN